MKYASRVPLLLVALSTGGVMAGDWPTWRHDAGRTAISSEPLADSLHLKWVRQYPTPEPAFWQVRQHRQQFDAGYEPVVAGKTLVVGSSVSDRVTALDIETGNERWRFYADGPVRLAPALWQNKVYFASDDGRLSCLDLADGRLLWNYRGAPSSRKTLGNGRLISVWPARGAPVVADGVVYFAAGVWPFEGIFVTALDAETGRVIWMNDRVGSLYREHPHGAMSFGGPSPQGYLMIHEDHLVVPSSRAFPAFFDRASGELVAFEFGHGGHGSRPGGWFVATDADNELVIDSEINTETHDVGVQIIGQTGVRRKPDEPLPKEVTVAGVSYRISDEAAGTIRAGGQTFRISEPPAGVEGPVHTMLAADGKLFVVSQEGSIYCFGPDAGEPRRHPLKTGTLQRPADGRSERANSILSRAGRVKGYAVVCGVKDGRLVEELALGSELHVIAVVPSSEELDVLRRRWDAAGLYGRRITALPGTFGEIEWPPYLADLITTEDLAAAGLDSPESRASAFRCLRPFGGALCLDLSDAGHEQIARMLSGPNLAGATLSREAGRTWLVRDAALPGAADYTGQRNSDALVRAPLGLLWFGDTFHHHKLFYKTFYHETGRGLPQTIAIVDGVMRYLAATEPYGPNPPGVGYADYLRLLERDKRYVDAYTDVYTGRVLSRDEVRAESFPEPAPPETTPPADIPVPPVVRRNPLTGVDEGRAFLKTYGCDRSAVDYGNLLTMRSGTAAFYDEGIESGTINISGIRSGCRNSIVPGCGVLALPAWTGNCTCNYPVFTSLALVRMPESFEQWTAWGDIAIEEAVERVGLNFGAPGDRVAEDGTLWLDCPSVGGPSPEVPVSLTPDRPRYFYRHALWMDRREVMPWLTGSGVEGVRSIRIVPVARKSEPPSNGFSVRWTGSIQPTTSATYTFHVRTDHGARLWINGQLVLDNAKALRRGNHDESSGSISLEADKQVDLALEYYHTAAAGSANHGVEFSWSTPDMERCPVPANCLVAADGIPGGLTGVYYANESFAGPAALRKDPNIAFAWDAGGPKPLRRLDAGYLPPDRTYDVEMWFAESEDLSPGVRVFSVRLEDREVLTGFDVAKETQGFGRSVVRRFTTNTKDGAIDLEFIPSTDKPPLVCGIRLTAVD